MHSANTWFEIPVADLAKSQRFYETLLDRPMRGTDDLGGDTIAVFAHEKPGAGGCIVHRPAHAGGSGGTETTSGTPSSVPGRTPGGRPTSICHSDPIGVGAVVPVTRAPNQLTGSLIQHHESGPALHGSIEELLEDLSLVASGLGMLLPNERITRRLVQRLVVGYADRPNHQQIACKGRL